ncbi:T9SS type A sorting domain-containing protein [Polaribacter cellanae]|uniref:T9SS type A sorting domain-containing protein n=1 Tax=Polaribacter cellanae TaxID=2818493 RepID=A0A975H5I6_9FLAO|nr:T9SS type A sorting domain-containing protein [Polaribacter cellanae]QTE21451.1 T9SS type A sorting domain-containing protein [Polaribacter cellanae]
MKTKLLLALLFISSIFYAQFPTNDLVGKYSFDNGALTDGANSNNFTQTGTLLTAQDDRFTAVNTNAIRLNGDYLTRSDVNFTGNTGSISFWVKTTTNNSNVETIYDDAHNRNSVADNTTWSGYYLFLQNGKVGFVIQQLFTASNIGRVGIKKTGATNVSDGKWHHITFSITQAITGTGQYRAGREIRNYLTTANLYIDDIFVDQAIINKSSEFGFNPNGNINSTGNITIANNRSNSLPTANKYKDQIDDLFIYNRALTRAEIAQIRKDGNYCVAPPNTIIGLSNTNNTSATITLSGSGNYDLAYYKQSESISNATIINNVSTNPINITGLEISTPYVVKIREHCNNVSDWSNDFVFTTSRPSGIIFVDATATGSNNGTSWQNAFTSLQDALSVVQTFNEKEVWIAKGTYKPDATNRSATFSIGRENVKVYGGFAGTEAQVSERIFGTNETILSGDLQNNDVNLTDFASNYANTTRNSDNSYHVFRVFTGGDNLLLDGITFSDAHNNKNTTERGGAIVKDKRVSKLTLKNCIIKNNVSRNDNAGLIAEFELNNTSGTRGGLIIENCKFINNMSRWASGIYSFVRANSNVDITVANSLFDNNLAADLSSTLTGISGSASWFRVVANGSDVKLNLVNNTYVNHKDFGTGQSLNNFTRAVVGISKTTNISSTFNATVSNCIFWNNKVSSNGSKSRSITDLYLSPINSLTVTNSLDELNFNDDSISSTSNNISTNPSFNADYSLKGNSPAIDTGDNSKVFGTTDLLGNQRIFNTTVDMGAYEFGSSSPLSVNNFLNDDKISIYPNPVSSIVNIKINAEVKKAIIYNLQGQKIIESISDKIDISNFAKGVYMLKVISEKNGISTKKFIKN